MQEILDQGVGVVVPELLIGRPRVSQASLHRLQRLIPRRHHVRHLQPEQSRGNGIRNRL